MKLRLEDNKIHFRVSKAELTELCQGKEISQSTPLPEGAKLSARIIPSDISSALAFGYENGSLVLRLQNSSARALLDQLPSRDDIRQDLEFDGAAVRLIFDVDIRTQKKPR